MRAAGRRRVSTSERGVPSSAPQPFSEVGIFQD